MARLCLQAPTASGCVSPFPQPPTVYLAPFTCTRTATVLVFTDMNPSLVEILLT